MASRCVAEDVFGWNRKAVELGIHEYQTGIACINDINARGQSKTEDKHPKLRAEIQAIMEPHSESESSLRTALLYTNITAKTVNEALVQKRWSKTDLPSALKSLESPGLPTAYSGQSKIQKNRRNRRHL